MNYVDIACGNVQLEEGRQVVEQLLIESYLNPGISTKELSRSLKIPVPITVAIRNELAKAGALIPGRGARCTLHGKRFVEFELGYDSIKKELWNEIKNGGHSFKLEELLERYQDIYNLRPQINAAIDQSKCTSQTSFKRAIHALKSNFVIGKNTLLRG